MALRRVKLRNWCQLRSLDIEFRPGLNGILGANGNGKSNFLDSLRFGVTGQSINGGNNKDNLTWGQEHGSVELDFVAGDTEYNLTRAIETSRCQLRYGNVRLAKAGEVEQYLVNLYDAPLKMLLDNVFVGQGKIDQILSARPGDRLKEFQASFGLDRAQDAYRLLGVEANSCQVTPELAALLKEAVEAVQEARNQVLTLELQSGALKAKIDGLAHFDELLAMAIETLRVAGAIRQADEQVGRADIAATVATQKLDKVTAAATGARQAHEGRRPGAEAAAQQVQDIEADRVRYQKGEVARTAVVTLKDELQHLTKPMDIGMLRTMLVEQKTTLARYKEMVRDPVQRPKIPVQHELEAHVQKLEAELRALGVTSITVPEPIQQTKRELDVRQKELDALGNGTCYACGQPVHGGPEEAARKQKEFADLQAKLDQLAKQWVDGCLAQRQQITQALAAANSQLLEFEKAGLAMLGRKVDELSGSVTALEHQIQQVEQSNKAYEDKQARLREMELVVSMSPQTPVDEVTFRALNDIVSAFKMSEKEVERIENDLPHLRASADSCRNLLVEAKRLRDGLGAIMAIPSETDLAHAKVKTAERAQAKQELEELSIQLGVAKGLEGQREQEARRLLEKSQHESDQAAWLEVVTRVREALHVSKYPAQAMREYAGILNSHMEIYLNLLEAPFRMWLDEAMEFQVLFTAGPKKGYQLPAHRLSGGERILASTSFRLAMADTFARKMGLLVLDEPSAYLDKDNIQHLQVLLLKLREISRTKGRQILIVTHEDSLKGFLDHVITI